MEQSSPIQKRGRGRPRKSQFVQSAQDSKEQKFHLSEEERNQYIDFMACKKQRKAGRPKKGSLDSLKSYDTDRLLNDPSYIEYFNKIRQLIEETDKSMLSYLKEKFPRINFQQESTSKEEDVEKEKSGYYINSIDFNETLSKIEKGFNEQIEALLILSEDLVKLRNLQIDKFNQIIYFLIDLMKKETYPQLKVVQSLVNLYKNGSSEQKSRILESLRNDEGIMKLFMYRLIGLIESVENIVDALQLFDIMILCDQKIIEQGDMSQFQYSIFKKNFYLNFKVYYYNQELLMQKYYDFTVFWQLNSFKNNH